jgi:hypothetical protein
MLNPFFQQGTKTEQGLMQSLINESIQIYGIDVYYIPREYTTIKKVMEEVIESKFNYAYPIEAYLKTFEGHEGTGTILSKFGIQEMDNTTLVISKERFKTAISPLLGLVADIQISSRPKEGDLIYFPLGDRLFEVKYVEHEQPFYQLNENYVYELSCELYRYESGEILDTNYDEIDDSIKDEGNIQTFQMVGVGSTASAITDIVYGGVRFVDVTNRGFGYDSTPEVKFSASPTANTAVGIASMMGGIVDICEPDDTKLRVQAVELINPGAGYTVAPMVSFIGGGYAKIAEATAYIGDGVIGIVTVTDGGSGYTTSPSVTFTGISSDTATGTAYINSVGVVTAIRITNAGYGYTVPPTITIEAPPSYSGIGTFIYNEVVVGSISSTTARVRSWNVITKILEIASADGNFTAGESLVGQESGASYGLRTINTDNLADPGDPSNKADKYAQNNDIQTLANEVMDTSEGNLFGIP